MSNKEDKDKVVSLLQLINLDNAISNFNNDAISEKEMLSEIASTQLFILKIIMVHLQGQSIENIDQALSKYKNERPKKPESKKSNQRLASKIKDKVAFLNLVEEQIFERVGILGKDLEKVNFDFENCSCEVEDFSEYKDILGYRKIGDFEFCGCYAGGDWEYPVFFLIYLDQDGKTLRGFIPREGNSWNYNTKFALGNDEEQDLAFLRSQPFYERNGLDLDDDEDLTEYGSELVNIQLIKETIASRFKVLE